nr:MAG TPA: hypothetical protein [Caudoviricetes sp.]
MPNINITVREKIAHTITDTCIVCGNSDYVAVFDFDAEWDAYEVKTARFIWGGTYTDVAFTGNECPVPVIPDAVSVLVGVYAGDLHTTTAAAIGVRRSILGGSETEAEVSREIRENLDKMFAGKIDVPQVAKVGEVLTVEEVDEDGKPTKWKTREMDVVRFSEQDLTYDQKTQARKNIDAIDRSYNIVNGFNDILKANCNLGVCRGIQMGSAPTGMCFPIIFLYGDSNRGITDLTLYDSKGQVWKTSNSRGEWGPFNLSNNENLIVNITELFENGSSRLVSDTSAEDIYSAIQNGKHVIAVTKGNSACSIFSCIDSNTYDDTYNNTFASLLGNAYLEYRICGTTLENTDVIDNYFELVTADDIENFAVNIDKAIKQERMHVTITATVSTGNLTYTADKTSKEILEAVSRGVVPTCTYPLTTAPYGPQEVACIFSQWVEMPGANSGYVSFTQTTDDITYVCNIDSSGGATCYQQNRDTSDKLVAPANAQAGQIVKVKSVDDSGIITETEAVDMAEQWELINSITVAEADATRIIAIDKDSNGNSFSCKKIMLRAKANSTIDSNATAWFCVNGTGGYNSGRLGFNTNYVKYNGNGYENLILMELNTVSGIVRAETTANKGAAILDANDVMDFHEVEFAGYGDANVLLYGTFALYGVRA